MTGPWGMTMTCVTMTHIADLCGYVSSDYDSCDWLIRVIINDSCDHSFCDLCDYDSRGYDSCDSPASQVSEVLGLSF